MDLKACIDVLLRRKLLVLLSLALIFTGAGLATTVLQPVYESSAKLYYQPLSLEAVSTVIGSSVSNRGATIDDHSHLEMLASTENIDAVINRLQIRDRSGRLMLQKNLTKSVPLTSTLFPRPYLTVSHTSDTFVLEVKASSTDPEQAAMMANTLAEVYIDHNRQTRLAELGVAKTRLLERIESEQNHYAQLQDKLRQEKVDAGVISLSDEYSKAVDGYYTMIQGKGDALKELAATSARIRKLREQLSSVGIDYIPGAAFTNYPAVSTLVQKINDAQNDLAAARVELKDSHPELVRYRERLKELNRLLETALKAFKATDTDLQSLQRQEEGLRASIVAIDARMATHLQSVRGLAENAARINPLDLAVSESKTNLTALLENLFKVISAEALSYEQIRLIQPAAPKRQDDTARPKTAAYLLVGAFLGLSAGIALAFLVDYLDESVRSVSDAKKLGLTVLAALPRKSPGQAARAGDGPYRDLRNRIRLASSGPPPQTLLVAGYKAGDQAAATALGLGRAMAGASDKILVVDADLANPTLAAPVGRDNAPGLAACLADGLDVLACVVPLGDGRLHVLTAGAAQADPGALLDSAALPAVFAALREAYAAVLVIAPALEASTDALLLAARADAVLLVARSGAASGAALVEARDALAAVGTPVLGLALAGCSPAERQGFV